MADIGKLCGTYLHYEPSEFNFSDLFLDVARKALGCDLNTLPRLEDIHHVLPTEKVSAVYATCYDFMDTEQFRSLFHAYILKHIQPIFGTEIFYQKKPGIRIHQPHGQTVQYHTDEWYGHGENVVNFWTPLTIACDTNSLTLATLEDSVRMVKELEEEKANISEINERLKTICKPLTLKVGDTVIFCAKVAHGTEKNLTSTTRISLDYRILLPGDSAGSKSVAEYYQSSKTYPIKAAKTTETKASSAVSYIFPKHGFTKFISAHQQRLLNQDYAKKNNVDIVAEETEIKTMSHHPALLGLVSKIATHELELVLVYSVMCLPESPEDRQKIYNDALKNKIRLAFPNEGLELCSTENISEVEGKIKELTS